VDGFLKAQILNPKCHHSAEYFFPVSFVRFFGATLGILLAERPATKVVLHQVFCSSPKRDEKKNV